MTSSIQKLADFNARVFQKPVPMAYSDAISQAKFVSFSDYSNRLPAYLSPDFDSIWVRKDTVDKKKEPLMAMSHLSAAGQEIPGQPLIEAITDRTLLDGMCGDIDICMFPRMLAQKYGRGYLGIDMIIKNEIRLNEFPELQTGHFEAFFRQDDLLTALSRIVPGSLGDLAILLIGARPKNPKGFEYAKFCMDEISIICKPGDTLTLGDETRGFFPDEACFTEKAVLSFPGGRFPDAKYKIYIRK